MFFNEAHACREGEAYMILSHLFLHISLYRLSFFCEVSVTHTHIDSIYIVYNPAIAQLNEHYMVMQKATVFAYLKRKPQ